MILASVRPSVKEEAWQRDGPNETEFGCTSASEEFDNPLVADRETVESAGDSSPIRVRLHIIRNERIEM